MVMRLLCCLFLAATFLIVGSVNQAKADTLTFFTVMQGGNEVPPTASPATGTTLATIDTVANTLTVNVVFSGLIGGNASAAHIHCCVPVGTNTGVAVGFTGFPGATSGTYTHVFDLLDPTTYTAGFLGANGGTAAGAEAALIAGLSNFRAYSNIHNSTFPGGEIRGQLAAVPEPATMLLLGAGLAGVMGAARKRRRKA